MVRWVKMKVCRWLLILLACELEVLRQAKLDRSICALKRLRGDAEAIKGELKAMRRVQRAQGRQLRALRALTLLAGVEVDQIDAWVAAHAEELGLV